MSSEAHKPDAHAEPELADLLATLLDGQLSESQEGRLHEVISSDADARQQYVDHCLVHALLHRELQASSLNLTAQSVVELAPRPHTAGRARRVARFFTANALALGGLLALVGLLSLAASIVLFLLGTARLGQQIAGQGNRQDLRGLINAAADADNSTDSVDPAANSGAAVVARLTRLAGCTWGKGAEPPKTNKDLKIGQQLRLESGLAELSYGKGVNMVLQGPAMLALEADNQVYLREGRLTARLTDEKARGFTVRTARTSVVDLGTEFGGDVAPGGDQNIHVFQGEVKLNVNGKDKSLLESRSLRQDQAARVNAATQGVALVKETGESFTRSIEHSGHDPHAVAYWRFEDHTVGMLVPDTSGSIAHVRGTTDSSGNGNDLFTFNPGTAPKFSDDVAADSVPQGERPNRSCLDNSSPPERALTRDLYTRSWFSHASPIDLQQIAPQRWTIECSVRPAQLHRGVQTFVSRDINYPLKRPEAPQRLVFQIDADDHFAVRFFDKEHRQHEAIANRLTLAEKQWYHLAAVSDGMNLKLYVDQLDGQGYRIYAATALPDSGSTALGKGDDAAAWLVGRGSNGEGTPVEWFCGWIDEVRISDVARLPAEFLFTARPNKIVRE